MHLGVLTGGGDVPGLNPAIKTIVSEANARGWRVTGFRRGWAGPLNFNPSDPDGSRDWIMPLDIDAVRGIDRTGELSAGELLARSHVMGCSTFGAAVCTTHVQDMKLS